MYRVLATCNSPDDESLNLKYGTSQLLISIKDFPGEFPYLGEYFRVALRLSLGPVPKKKGQFQVNWDKLEWIRCQQIIL